MNRQKHATQRTKEKETKGKDKKRDENNEIKIVVKIIGRVK